MSKHSQPKTVTLDLTTVDSNAYSLMGAFERQARREGWTQSQIETVLKKCRSGSYDNLVATLMMHCA